MAGDASLGITPVMKWNFERSCYRWLVTRHPAQFERLDFTAQILQSASRARKAFYECGWAEAKVLIRPSDGKFERTPFFDAIIRRGLRNSTRFDASTLTEDEIEALGMHRDETLGFKLQIRHFRSSRKELPPQGRGGGGVRKAPVPPLPPSHRHGGPAASTRPMLLPSPNSASPPSQGTLGGGSGDVGGGRDRAPPVGVEQQQPQQQQQQRPQWGAEVAVPAPVVSRERRWTDEARWHRGGGCGVNGTSGPVMDGSIGGGDRWSAWDANRWMPAGNDRPGTGLSTPADDRHHHRYTNHPSPPLVPGLARISSSAVGVANARRAVWEGAPTGGGWGAPEVRPGSSWRSSPAASAEGRVEGFERGIPNGISEGDGGARDGFAGDRRQQQTDADIRASGGFRFHQSVVEHPLHPGPSNRVSSVVPGGLGSAGSAPGFRHGAVGIDIASPARVESPESSSVGGDGSLLSQGYRRLAAMEERAAACGGGGGQLDTSGEGSGRRAGPPAAVLNHSMHHSPVRPPPLPHTYELVAAGERGHKRPAPSAVGSNCRASAGSSRGEGWVGHGQRSQGPMLSPQSGGGDGSTQKKMRPSVDGGERSFGGNIGGGVIQQQDDRASIGQRARSSSSERRLVHTVADADADIAWSRGVAASGTPPPDEVKGVDVLARELAESERELLSSRVAVDLAKARYEEASRTHDAKREQVRAAAAATAAAAAAAEQQQQQQRRQRNDELHSLARSFEATAGASSLANRAMSGGRDAGGGGRARVADGSGVVNSGVSGDRPSCDVAAIRRASPPPCRSSSMRTSRSAEDVRLPSPSNDVLALPKDRSSSCSPSASASEATVRADEMREVELEAALLYGIGRTPVASGRIIPTSGSPSAAATAPPPSDAGAAGAGKGLKIVSLAAAAASSPTSVGHKAFDAARRSSSSSPDAIRRGGGGCSGGGGRAPHSPLAPPAWKSGHLSMTHQAERAAAGTAGRHHHIPRSAVGQMPDSPLVSGETDSDHSSDSMGCTAVDDSSMAISQQQHQLRPPPLFGGGGRGSGRNWGEYRGRGRGGDDRHAPPLAKLTADVLV